jgi:hypothetical protein
MRLLSVGFGVHQRTKCARQYSASPFEADMVSRLTGATPFSRAMTNRQALP